MTFEARVYIQGVAVYVPEEDGQQVTVLFPDHEAADRRNLKDYRGNKIREHHAVVQFDSWNVEQLPEALRSRKVEVSDRTWSGVDASGCLLKIAADPGNDAKLPRDLLDNGRVPGVPHLPEIMGWVQLADELRAFDRQALPADGTLSELLKAALVLDAGVLSPASDFDGAFHFIDPAKSGSQRRIKPPAPTAPRGRRRVPRRPEDPEMNFSSVLKLELGEVESFQLEFHVTSSDSPTILRFDPPYDELDVWIRHFCTLERPDSTRAEASDELIDVDFALNYALQKELERLLELKGHDLPMPEISPSWAGGGPVGDETLRCMGSSGGG